MAHSVSEHVTSTLDLGDLQRGVLSPRPSPYAGAYLFLSINDPAAGREALKRLNPLIASAADQTSPLGEAWLAVALTYQGLRALGVPRESLASFSPEFQQGMRARAPELGDVGANDPRYWESPFGTPDLHLALAVLAPDPPGREAVVARAYQALEAMPGLTLLSRQDGASLPTGREHFGFQDGISQPAIEGTGMPPSNPLEAPLKAGEFVLGYPDEWGRLTPLPQPEVLGRSGAYVALRKLHQDVAAFRRFLAEHAESTAEEEWLSAKIVGRWPSGAPLALAPEQDDPALAADSERRNAFLYYEHDPKGLQCPLGSHIRRMNPRDSFKDEVVQVNRHRVFRRGQAYGPVLPAGVLEDDGAERGMIFLFVGADLKRQFEFVQREWINQGTFIGASAEQDPLIGPSEGTGVFTIPKQPIRRRLQGLPQFVTVRGGEYFFMPGLSALHWLADLVP
jgi:Dyp-type peroxidase family